MEGSLITFEETGGKNTLLYNFIHSVFLSSVCFYSFFLTFLAPLSCSPVPKNFLFTFFKKNDTVHEYFIVVKIQITKLKSCLIRTPSLICPCLVHLFRLLSLHFSFPSLTSYFFFCVFLIAYA